MNKAAMKWIAKNWDPKKLPSEAWIAVGDEGLIASSSTFQDLMVRLKFAEPMRLVNGEVTSVDSKKFYESLVFCYTDFGVWQ